MTEPAPFVEVEWTDARSCATWMELDDLPKVAHCITRGWLIDEDKEQVVIAATFQIGEDEDGVGEVITIYRGMVKRIRRLKVSYGR